jgi:hypothetical protein
MCSVHVIRLNPVFCSVATHAPDKEGESCPGGEEGGGSGNIPFDNYRALCRAPRKMAEMVIIPLRRSLGCYVKVWRFLKMDFYGFGGSFLTPSQTASGRFAG